MYFLKSLKNDMSSAAESKVAGLFMNAQNTVLICLTLEDMGHPQAPTPYVLITLLHIEYFQGCSNTVQYSTVHRYVCISNPIQDCTIL